MSNYDIYNKCRIFSITYKYISFDFTTDIDFYTKHQLGKRSEKHVFKFQKNYATIVYFIDR